MITSRSETSDNRRLFFATPRRKRLLTPYWILALLGLFISLVVQVGTGLRTSGTAGVERLSSFEILKTFALGLVTVVVGLMAFLVLMNIFAALTTRLYVPEDRGMNELVEASFEEPELHYHNRVAHEESQVYSS